MLALDVSNEPIESCLPPILAQIWDTRLSCVIAEKNNHQSEEKALFFGSYLHLGRVRTASIAHSRIIYSSLLYTLSCIVLPPFLSQLETLLLQNNSLSLRGNEAAVCDVHVFPYEPFLLLPRCSSSTAIRGTPLPPPSETGGQLRPSPAVPRSRSCLSPTCFKLRHWRCHSLSAPSPRPRSPS